MERDRVVSRRNLLQSVGGVTLGLATAGCNALSNGSTRTPTNTPTPTDTPTPTGTPRDNQAPTIVEYRVEPRQNGSVLHVSMTGEDDRQLDTARVIYGDRELTQQADGKSITIDGELQDTAANTPEDGRIAYVLTDAAVNETRKHVQPDDTAPELALMAQPTANAGEVALTVNSKDDTGLASVYTLLDGDTAQRHDTSGTDYSNERTVTAPEDRRLRSTSVGARAQDWNGNTTEKEIQTYVRKYSREVEDVRVNLATEYFSAGGRMFECIDGITAEPAIGIEGYGTPPTSRTVDKHIDQMTGFKIPRLNINYEGHDRHVKNILQSQLIDQINISAEYFVSVNHFWKDEVDSWKDDIVEPHMTFLRDTIYSRDNIATHDGCHIFTISNASGGWVNPDRRERIMEEWGSYEKFVNDIRNLLTVGGREPFIIGTFGGWGDDAYRGFPADELATNMDAVRNQKFTDVLGQDTRATWTEALQWAEESFAGNRDYAQAHDLEFVPQVVVGQDDRANTCWGFNEHLPRRPERYRELLELADEYRTTDLIDQATWNDWTEGDQIEPGTFRGEDYGTAYLQVIKEFQRNNEEAVQQEGGRGSE